MYRLSPIILLLGFVFCLQAQSPHGADYKVDCAACHTSDDWEIPMESWNFIEPENPKVSKSTGWINASDTTKFNHYNTNFPLLGQHSSVNCRECHETLVFQEASVECISCHTDMHQQTVGPDCARCHSSENWLVDNISELHLENGFPLIGAHGVVSCDECHISESEMNFQRIGNDCVNCHLEDFNATTDPDHSAADYSLNCIDCHDLAGLDWSSNNILHDFFPLTKGHDISDCAQCHIVGDYSNISSDCVSCHQEDYDNALNPDHQNSQFSINCTECHTTDIDWMPAEYRQHDSDYFPIYSGEHGGEWDNCTDCHLNPSNFAEFTCVSCHKNPGTDNEHGGVGGYSYVSTACLACHPNGSEDDNFDHNLTAFPLTGEHRSVDCIECHASGYQGTPTDCAACHLEDFEQTTNPDHNSLGISTECASCHTTVPDWMPATFDTHNEYYALTGAHEVIANDCAACHNGDYTNTPNTCAGCHQSDFDQSSNPNHVVLGFSNDCESCHTTEPDWMPATFDTHDEIYPLTGEHALIANDCAACHNGDYTNTSNTCAGCHQSDYDQSINPNHVELGLPNDCGNCHTTEPDWMPATFDMHNDFYTLKGAHAVIANDCASCHNGDYNNTPATCYGCHTEDYNNTENPNHFALQFSTDCQDCHSEDTWIPATFDHDGHFPIYSGEHEGEWSDCVDCHTTSNYMDFTCVTCHENTETEEQHLAVGGYIYESGACLACHPTGNSEDGFDHNLTAFPLTGAHITVDCISCHEDGYQNTSTECASCHMTDFDQSTNPNHNSLGLSTDCASCHTTEPAWSPATFAIHDEYYVLNGAHSTIANDCISCHNGDYTNTPNTCAGCHTEDYNQTTEPDHEAAQFPLECERCHSEDTWIPSTFEHSEYYPFTGTHAVIANDCIACHNGDYTNTPNTCAGCHQSDFDQSTNPNHGVLGLPNDCESCHTTEPDWMPATFDMHNDFYVLNGTHALIANDCASCHNGDYNNTPNSCYGCHTEDYNNAENPNHLALQFSTDCQDCHSEDTWVPATFDHDGQYFPIYSGDHEGEWSECIDCHTNPSNFAEFSCVSCHANSETDDQHPGISGYVYESEACLACHPTGNSEDGFDHNLTAFPLTGAHIGVDCISCHAGGYQGTSTDCAACHTDDFDQSTNPNHNSLGLSTDCASCHTTDPGWSPASFAVHNEYYMLNDAHSAIANECTACHNGDYNNTPNTCAGCHTEDFNQTTEPDHEAAQFSLECESCHTEDTWIPSTFDHSEYYPFTGGHEVIANDCAACHNGDYSNTPNTCVGCHQSDFDQSSNPNHVVLGLSNDCESCHTTAADWMPATFDSHNNYYALNGAHAMIANDCASCHNGDYNNTPNTCAGCHLSEYNQANNPNHQSAGFPLSCESCHSENAWEPSNFNHDSDYFPIYSGKHQGEWNNCVECHTTANNFMAFSCIDCHEHNNAAELARDHEDVNNYEYVSSACYSCHPTGEED